MNISEISQMIAVGDISISGICHTHQGSLQPFDRTAVRNPKCKPPIFMEWTSYHREEIKLRRATITFVQNPIVMSQLMICEGFFTKAPGVDRFPNIPRLDVGVTHDKHITSDGPRHVHTRGFIHPIPPFGRRAAYSTIADWDRERAEGFKEICALLIFSH